MVLYFSGTGNSYYIAKKIAELLGDQLVSIADLVRSRKYAIHVEKEETIGFVYPVHACAPPDLVTNFIKELTIENYNQNYMYSVYNCAGTPEYTSRIMKETCEKRGYELSGFYEVLMPGNYVTVKKHLPEEKARKYLQEADGRITTIVEEVRKRSKNYKKEKHSYLLSYVLHKLAVLEKDTKFTVGDGCVACGKCAAICPMKAISMESGKPVRDVKQCAFCLGCINVCPTQALQAGKKTIGNQRYVHSEYMEHLRWNHD